MEKESVNIKGVSFWNSSHETIKWHTTDNMPILTVASNLRFPDTPADFFETVKEQIGDEFPSIVRFTKAGYLKLVFK